MSVRVVKQQLAALQQSQKAADKLGPEPAVTKRKKLRKRNKKQAARLALQATGQDDRQKEDTQKVLKYLRVTTQSKVTTQAAESMHKVTGLSRLRKQF